jgi:hypothetical protein
MNAKTEPAVLERGQKEAPSGMAMSHNLVSGTRADVMAQSMAPTPMTMLDAAVRQGVSIETLDKLMALQERWEANEARKAFSAAMADFRAENITVQKNKTAKFKTDKGVTQYDYATLDVVCEAIVGSLSKHGLSHHWETKQSGDQVTVTCHVTHRMGHRESTSLTSGLDQTGSKNKIQALGSAVRYLERYTLLAATGLAVKDKEDDDGHDTEGTTTAPALSEQEKAAKEKLDACGSIGSLTETWGKLDKDTRRKLNDVFGECKRKIEAADLRERLAKAERDARRYRWLRDECDAVSNPQDTWILEAPADMWDDGIDAAIESEKGDSHE